MKDAWVAVVMGNFHCMILASGCIIGVGTKGSRACVSVFFSSPTQCKDCGVPDVWTLVMRNGVLTSGFFWVQNNAGL